MSRKNPGAPPREDRSTSAADSWQRICELFEQAVELPTEERRDYLRRSCRDDPELLKSVVSLLEADREAVDFLEEPLVPVSSLL